MSAGSKRLTRGISRPGSLVPMGRYSALSNQLRVPSFSAELRTSFKPEICTGVGSFTRATIGTVQDWEGVVRTALAGEVRFQGARRVRNIGITSESSSGWTPQANGTGSIPIVTSGQIAPDGTATAFRIQATLNGGATGADSSYVDLHGTLPALTTPRYSIWIKNNGGAGTDVLLRQNSAQQIYVVTITNFWQRYSISTAQVIGVSANNIGTVGLRGNVSALTPIDILIWHPQLEDITGQVNTSPSEYVSIGVQSAPYYHGSGVDGCKCFDYQNRNIVQNNVVIENALPPVAIPAAILAGYVAEGARTNLCLQSEDFATTWTLFSVNAGVTVNAATAPDGNITADKLIEATITADIHRVDQTIAKAASALSYSFSCFAKASERTRIRLQMDDAANGAVADFDLSGGVVISSGGSGGTPFTTISATIKTYPNGWYLCTLIATSSIVASIVVHALLMSGAATNYAGTVNSGAYLWGAQLEEASFASSYISTTTVAVTRNNDSLLYPSAGNLNSGANPGTFYCEFQQPIVPGDTRRYVFRFDETGTTSRLCLRAVDTPNIFTPIGVASTGAANPGVIGSVITANILQKVAFVWGASGLHGAHNGAIMTGADSTPSSIVSANTTFGVGCNNVLTSNELMGTIRNAKIWSVQQSDATLQSLTA